MVQIYSRQHPGDDRLISLLGQQHDRELGFAALKGSSAKWLGENRAKLLGYWHKAMEISGNQYILTVIEPGVYADACVTLSVKLLIILPKKVIYSSQICRYRAMN